MEKLSDVKQIFFDVGYTLVDELDAWKIRVKKQSKMPCVNGKKYSAKEIFDEVIEKSGDYGFNYQQVVNNMGYTQAVPYEPNEEKPYKDLIKVLDELHGKYKLCIMANQPDGLQERLDKWGITKYFDVIVSSFDVKLKKPDTQIFEYALKMANCQPKDAVYIGDRRDNDVYPAKQVGMKTVLIRQGNAKQQKIENDKYIADVEVDSLIEILPLFDNVHF